MILSAFFIYYPCTYCAAKCIHFTVHIIVIESFIESNVECLLIQKLIGPGSVSTVLCKVVLQHSLLLCSCFVHLLSQLRANLWQPYSVCCRILKAFHQVILVIIIHVFVTLLSGFWTRYFVNCILLQIICFNALILVH